MRPFQAACAGLLAIPRRGQIATRHVDSCPQILHASEETGSAKILRQKRFQIRSWTAKGNFIGLLIDDL